VNRKVISLASLTHSNADQHRLIDEFYAHDGLMHFSDSEDKNDAEDEEEVFFKERGETK